MISAIGGQLSVLSVFGYVGAAQAGEYYMASAIFSAVVGLPTAIFSAAFPVMSGMTDAKKALSWQITKYSLLISTPLAILVGLYASEILSMLNPDLVNAVIPQRILLIGVVPAIINYGIYYVLYANGNYKSVLGAGLIENLSRISLYLLLVPALGATGASVSYISGSFLSMIFMVFSQRRYFLISWKRVLTITAIPSSTGLGLFFSALDPIIGVPILLLTCIFFYLRLDMATTDEIRGIVFSLMPPYLASKVFRRLEKIVSLVGKSQLFNDSART
jgi:O-antigen/teichoic acid export membrane protein